MKTTTLITLLILCTLSLQLIDVNTKVDTLIKQQDQIIQTLQVQLSTPILRPEDVEK